MEYIYRSFLKYSLILPTLLILFNPLLDVNQMKLQKI